MRGWAHVYWLGGAPCAGKSSMTELLVQRYAGLRRYQVDAELRVDQLSPARQPTLYKWTHTAWQELWNQPPARLLAEAIAAYREHFALAWADVQTLATNPHPLLVEGTCLLPDCVAGAITHPHQALWVVPSPDFLRVRYPVRGAWVQAILSQCTDPAQAQANWLDRDEAFAAWISAETTRLDLRLITVDGRTSIAEHADQVAAHFRAFQPSSDNPSRYL